MNFYRCIGFAAALFVFGASATPAAFGSPTSRPWVGKWSLFGSDSCSESVGTTEALVGFTATEIGEIENGGDILKVSQRDGIFTLVVLFNRGESAGDDIGPENRFVVISEDGKHAMIGSKNTAHYVTWNTYDRCPNTD